MLPVARVRCADGRTLDVRPVPVLDRQGTAYEVTLRLLLDGAPFGEVGERCGHALAALRDALLATPDAQVPAGLVEQGVRRTARADGADPDATWEAARRYLPRDVDLLVLRARDPDDVGGSGALRVQARPDRRFVGGAWQARTDVVVEAWGDHGAGVSAVLDLPGLCRLLDAVLEECAAVASARDGA